MIRSYLVQVSDGTQTMSASFGCRESLYRDVEEFVENVGWSYPGSGKIFVDTHERRKNLSRPIRWEILVNMLQDVARVTGTSITLDEDETHIFIAIKDGAFYEIIAAIWWSLLFIRLYRAQPGLRSLEDLLEHADQCDSALFYNVRDKYIMKEFWDYFPDTWSKLKEGDKKDVSRIAADNYGLLSGIMDRMPTIFQAAVEEYYNEEEYSD